MWEVAARAQPGLTIKDCVVSLKVICVVIKHALLPNIGRFVMRKSLAMSAWRGRWSALALGVVLG